MGIFSDFQDDKMKLATSYERIIRFLAFIGLPLSVLLFFTAEEVAPAQRMADFVNNRLSYDLPKSSYAPGLISAFHFIMKSHQNSQRHIFLNEAESATKMCGKCWLE